MLVCLFVCSFYKIHLLEFAIELAELGLKYHRTSDHSEVALKFLIASPFPKQNRKRFEKLQRDSQLKATACTTQGRQSQKTRETMIGF